MTEYKKKQQERIKEIEREMQNCTLNKDDIKRKRSRKQACKSRVGQREREEVHRKHLDVILEFFSDPAQKLQIAKFFDDATVVDADFKAKCKL